MSLTRMILVVVAVSACTASENPEEAQSPGGLKVASFGASTMIVTEHAGVQLSAILVDSDGPDVIQAGAATDVDTGGTYGTFAATSTPGTFTIELGWQQFNAMTPISAPPVDGTTREVRAEFFDTAGHHVQATAAVTLRCQSDLQFARQGYCDPWFHSECGVGWCGVTNNTNYVRSGTQMCAAAVNQSVCMRCYTLDDTQLGCSALLPAGAKCDCYPD